MLGKSSKYIVDGLQLDLFLLNDESVGVELPASVVMRVKDVEMSGHYWHATMEGPARLETGMVVLVPHIISPGDRIRVNTENGEYRTSLKVPASTTREEMRLTQLAPIAVEMSRKPLPDCHLQPSSIGK